MNKTQEKILSDFTRLQLFINNQLGIKEMTIDKEEIYRKVAKFAVKMYTQHGISQLKTLLFLKRKFKTLFPSEYVIKEKLLNK